MMYSKLKTKLLSFSSHRNLYSSDVLLKIPRQFRRDKVIFIHVPKCAGSAFLDSYLGYQLGHVRVETYFKLDPLLFSESFVFSFVRNPIHRFISAYNYIQRTTLWSYLPEIKQKLDTYASSVDELAKTLSKESEILSLPWFEPQHHYLTVNNIVAVNRVFKTENFAEDLEVLKTETGLNFRSESPINVSPKLVTDYKEILSSESIKNLEMVYEKDFTLFGYF
ncbi:sulfotransferase family 2 domain-containing protein [Anabaena sp. UHCC 0451]|uniref:sulfotransferase family 2 domain-containing protein n=1 Tax=Anabaena sp. UHCC 0451 TaxID=2055235 RepID=UPI002B1FC793|nr:sulfotransferase family 2 domain-containing protein [Anabaena sp. UHCC 0451]MEA5575027.1 sulfotransferase family 2 domain-containing protein [Anabaena sp. UHCC 0451]